MVIIDAIEIDERLASHLVGPDPLLRDQLIRFRFSEFAMRQPSLNSTSRRLLSSLSAMVQVLRWSLP